MAFDPILAARVREQLASLTGVDELRMMGALVFMHHGHMMCGVTGDDLMIRIDPARRGDLLSRPHVRPFEMGGGRAPRGFLCVEPGGIADAAELARWLDEAKAFSVTLPPKRASQRRK